jgi:DNA-binding winged helix-turn-helix (wHTH) protein/TolB-like protein
VVLCRDMNGRIRFGQFDFDPRDGALWRDGRIVRLQPQPARVLALLTARAGEIVGRDELRREVWGDGTFVDFERGLNFCVAQIRSVLGDSADSPRFVETLPRRGYRFIAPVTAVATEEADRTDSEPSQAASGSAVPSRGSRRQKLMAAAAIVIAVTAAAGLVRSLRHEPIPIAVVPFDNETGVESGEDIARGIADATVARLATPERLAQLSVIGNAAVLRRPRAFRDLKAIGDELGARYVVLAQVKRDDSRVRLIAHLIRVSDQQHVWANTFDRPAFTLDVQSEIAEAIASAVAARIR